MLFNKKVFIASSFLTSFSLLNWNRWNLLACVVLFWIKSHNLAFAWQQPCHLFYLFTKFNFSVNATMCQMRETNWALNTKTFTRRFAFDDECRCPTSFQFVEFACTTHTPSQRRRHIDLVKDVWARKVIAKTEEFGSTAFGETWSALIQSDFNRYGNSSEGMNRIELQIGSLWACGCNLIANMHILDWNVRGGWIMLNWCAQRLAKTSRWRIAAAKESKST